MAEKGSPKDSAKVSLNPKRFAFDVLSFSLTICGVPESKLLIKEDKQNDYSNPDYIVQIHAAVASIALNSRDKWKRMFETRQKSSGLDNVEKIQKYLSTMVHVLPEFRTEESDKIFTSLALYSEIFLFLNSNNIDVDFDQFLDMWSSYFNETISLNKNKDEVFRSLFFEHPNIHGYLRLVLFFIQDIAIPYGNKEVSMEFGKFIEAVEDFDDERNSIAEALQERIVSRLGFMPHNLRHPLPEVVEESVSLYSTVLERDSVLPGNRESSPDTPVCPYGFHLLPSGATGVENRFHRMNIGRGEKPEQDAIPNRCKNDKKKPD